MVKRWLTGRLMRHADWPASRCLTMIGYHECDAIQAEWLGRILIAPTKTTVGKFYTQAFLALQGCA